MLGGQFLSFCLLVKSKGRLNKGFGWRNAEMGKPFCLSVLGLKVNSDYLSTLKGSEESSVTFFN